MEVQVGQELELELEVEVLEAKRCENYDPKG
jgi:hypothetical protein